MALGTDIDGPSVRIANENAGLNRARARFVHAGGLNDARVRSAGDRAIATANATNTIALLPGSFGSMWGYRRELASTERRMYWLVLPSFVGGILGALLLGLLAKESIGNIAHVRVEVPEAVRQQLGEPPGATRATDRREEHIPHSSRKGNQGGASCQQKQAPNALPSSPPSPSH